MRLEPLTLGHVEALARVGLEPELWRLQMRPVASVVDMRAYVSTALEEMRQGTCLPFAIVHKESGQVIGSTRYGDIVPEHRRLEIGWTWLTSSHQRTPANTDAKLLLLTHAFETLGAIRVSFKTDVLNETSRNAILRLGAVEEGTFRSHMIADNGRVRDTVYFSIVDTEWPAVKARLSGKMS